LAPLLTTKSGHGPVAAAQVRYRAGDSSGKEVAVAGLVADRGGEGEPVLRPTVGPGKVCFNEPKRMRESNGSQRGIRV
jgi:hypothetical protein